MKLRSLLLTIFVFAAGAMPAFAQMGSSGVEWNAHMAGRITPTGFLEELMRDTFAQVEWSRIVQARTTDPEIKAFAKKIENQSRIFAYDINQAGQAIHAQFDSEVSGKLKEKSDKLRTVPVDQLDVEYLKSLQDVGHQIVDLIDGQYKAVIDGESKGIAVRESVAVGKEDSEAHDLQKKRRK
jgi:predicted outer membrane protein